MKSSLHFQDYKVQAAFEFGQRFNKQWKITTACGEKT